eukprot:5733482-Prorocentrum_lima.AAC.1
MSARRCWEAGASEEPDLSRTEENHLVQSQDAALADEKATAFPTLDADSLRQDSALEDLACEHISHSQGL